MKAVIYARYSSDNQREESIEGQLRECKAYAEKNNITVITSYIDRAYSAKTDNRPDFQKMIKDSGKKLFDVVIVWKLDRFARNRYDSAHYKAILRKNGVKVVSATEVIAADSTGILLESMLEGFAEYYSADLSEKVKRGQTENVLKGKSNGGNPTFGYIVDENHYFKCDPINAPIVLDMFISYDAGMTVKEIEVKLAQKGIRTLKGKPFTHNMITYILKNRRYLGEYRYNDILIPDGIPQIVPTELFERVAVRMEKNRKAPARAKAKEETYLLTTKLFCGHCGGMMVGESGTSHTKRIYQYYKCTNTKRKKICTKKTVKKAWIEELVVGQILKVIFDDHLIDELAERLLGYQGKEDTYLPVLKKQLGETRKSIQNILNAIEKGVFTAAVQERLEKLESTRDKLYTSILEYEIKQPVFSKEEIIFWLHKFRKMDISNPLQRQCLVDSFINAVYVYDDKIVLVLNYKDDTKAIDLETIESSNFDKLAVPNRKR